MTAKPSAMQFGGIAIISPDGSDAIPSHLWPVAAALELLDADPGLAKVWAQRLEAGLGVREVHRAYVAGGADAVQTYVRGQRATQVIVDEFSRIADDLPFPGEGPEPTGHSLTERIEDDDDPDRWRRVGAIRDGDERLAWFLARTATRLEARAEANLIRSGLAVYVPRLTYRRRISRERRRAELPLFGGYLFVGLGKEQTIEQVEKTDGVHDVVRISGVPRQLAFAPIAALIQAELDGEYDRTRHDRSKDPKPGTPVEIVAGYYQGWPAKFMSRREDERIDLMLKMFGRDVPFLVDPDEVELPEPEVKP